MRRSLRLSGTLIAALFLQPATARHDAPRPTLSWQAPLQIAAGGGERGPWRQNDSRYDYVDDGTVAFAGSGDVAVAWVDQKRKDVFLRKVGAQSLLGAPVNVSRSPATFSWQPRIAVGRGKTDSLYVLWQEIIFSGGSHGGEILFARSGDGGASFSAPLNLSRSRGGDGKGRLDRATWSNGSHDMAVAPNGDIVAAWTEYHGALWLARSRDGGASFTAPRRVAGDDARPARAPALAIGPDGAVWLAWTVGEDPGADIHVARSGDGGDSFGPAQRVGASPGHADAPRLAIDGAGTVHLVYAEAANGPGRPASIRYARAPGGADGFSAPRTISGLPARGSGGAGYPALGLDGGKGVVVVWERFNDAGGRPQGLGIAASVDSGERFTAPAAVPGSAAPPGVASGSHQGLLGKKLAVDGSGALAVVNSAMLPGVRSRVSLVLGRSLP